MEIVETIRADKNLKAWASRLRDEDERWQKLSQDGVQLFMGLAMDQGMPFAFETVFSTDDKLDFVTRAKASGYFVRVFFVGTSDPRINAARVANRVIHGGHTVPIDKIVSRYRKSLANLAPALRIADRVYIYDNSVEDVDARLCARSIDGEVRKIYGPLPEWIAEVIDPLPRHADFADLRVG